MTTSASSFKKGDVVRTVKPRTAYMSGPGDRVIAYQDVEVRVYTVVKVLGRRNRLKVEPHPSSPGIGYGCTLLLNEYPGTVEKVG